MFARECNTKQLCMDLLHADTEDEVIRILRQRGYWDNPDAWRPFGDREDNFSTIGNQSSDAHGALVEKLVNSVDAVLMGECGAAGILPNSPEAPRSISEAVAQFIFQDRSKANTLGDVSYWSQQQRRRIASRITLAATGSRQNPSLTVADVGEGQTPESMPDTLLSLDKQNKIDVHFVQGKFNMGGTGALRFCGRHNLQLMLSRRNPNITSGDSVDRYSGQWGFTVVRREDPTGSKRVSTYTCLAPKAGGVLRFDAEVLPLFPMGNRPYVRDAKWGTLVKLYEYKLRGGKSHILRKDGLLQRLDILLPQIALPIRMHECRNYLGHQGSFDTTLNGLSVRLNDDRNKNLEPDFPTSSVFTIRGEQMGAEVYAFKRGKDGNYKRSEGVIFAVNGQTHGSLSQRFFSRRSVGMNRLEDSILVIVDCSRISGRNREDLFMNSRDRMEQGEFLTAIESELESTLKENRLLRALKERRRREDVESKLGESKPYKDVLESILRKSPLLAALLKGAGPLSNPFRSTKARPVSEFLGKQHPSFFRFRDTNYGKELKRTTAVNMRSRIAFETDVVNDYFTRRRDHGDYVLRSLDDPLHNGSPPSHTLNLQNGVATLNLSLPYEAKVGDTLRYELAVQDETLIDPFVNRFVISVGTFQNPSGGPVDPQPRPNETFQGLAVPDPIPVYEHEWENHNFDKNSALKVVYDSLDDEEGMSGYHTYYINMDNIYLKTELKATKETPDILRARWQYGMVLIGMALLLNHSDENSDGTAEAEAAKATAAIAPVLLPLIEHLGALSD